MRKLVVCLALAAFVCAVLAAPQAQARPQYLKAFTTKYEKVKEKAEELKCGVCHGEMGKNKKKVSDYGKAIAEALGKKNVKGADDIAAAFDKTAEMKPEGADKTYGDSLAAGELPKMAE